MTEKFKRLSPSALAASCLSGWALSTLFLFPDIAQAQVSLSPMVIQVQEKNGQTEGIINVTNSSNQPFRARVYAQPFTYSRNAGFQTVPSSSNDLTPYLQFSPRELNIPPGVTRRVRLITRFAPNIADGEYRAAIFTEKLNENTNNSVSSVNIQTRIAVTAYVRKGNVSPNLAVESASFNPEQKQIQLLVRNTGKASTQSSVTWTLKQGEKVVKTGNQVATTVIAQGDRNFLLQYPGKDQPALAPGAYQLTGELVWGEDDKKSKVPFSVNLTIPARAAATPSR